MSKKTTGLRTFGTAQAPKAPVLVAEAAAPADEPRRRGPAKTYEKPRRGVTLRFTDEQHERLRAFAFEERTTIQDLALSGIAKMFEGRGLPKPW